MAKRPAKKSKSPKPSKAPKTSSIGSLAIIGGCGHVGLPLGLMLADAGWSVTLVDTSRERVAQVRAGKMPFMERGAEPLLARALAAKRLKAVEDLEGLAEHDVVVVTIGTPVDEYHDPETRPFFEAMDGILYRMKEGQLLVLRSTLFPGVTELLAARIAAKGPAVDLAYCPERIAQGYAIEELKALPQLVAGIGARATARAVKVFRDLGARTLEVKPIEAELGKLFANAHRYIHFAISNQFYMIAEGFGADFARIRDAVSEEYPRLKHFARSGFAGGPCLFKDTMQLGAFNHATFPLGQAAMIVNEGLPTFLVERLRMTRDLSKDTVGILGMAFKGDSDDPRTSLAYKLRKILALKAKQVLCTDPYIKDPGFVPLAKVLKEADVIFIGAPHSEYRRLRIQKPLIDVFDALPRGGRR
jgi:UDP-N-acetyl-D-mannosaminuronic acid dehydrogenase